MRLSESRDHKRQKIGEGDTSKSSVGIVYPMYGDVETDRTQVHLFNQETRRYDRTEVDQKCPEMLQEYKDKHSMVVDVDLRSDEQVNPPHPKLKNLMPGKEYDRQELIPTEGAKVGQCQSGGDEDQIVHNTNGKKVVVQANHFFEQEDQGSQWHALSPQQDIASFDDWWASAEIRVDDQVRKGFNSTVVLGA
uniref:Uncharacterized protein n=1 Tax=Oryza nivara TaxID=4536 RepID=A0A0E0GG13_ORYNI